MLSNLWLNSPEGSVLPAILSFEACKGEAILQISSNLSLRVSNVPGCGKPLVGSKSNLCNFDPSHDLLSDLRSSIGVMLRSGHDGRERICQQHLESNNC